MALTDKRNFSILLVIVLLSLWCSHAFINTAVVTPFNTVVTMTDDHAHNHGHDHQLQEQKQEHSTFGIDHQHSHHTPDHSHDSVQLPGEVTSRNLSIDIQFSTLLVNIPTAPLYLIKKPPRLYS